MPLRTLIVLLCGWLATLAPALCRASEPVADTALKEAVVFNLLMFVDWPQTPMTNGAPLRFCVLTGQRDSPLMAGLEGRRLGNRILALNRVNRDLGGLSRCDAIFVEAGNPGLLATLVTAARHNSLLVIAEGDQAVQQGATIALTLASGRFVFDINLAVARSANLVISSKLLRLARLVVE